MKSITMVSKAILLCLFFFTVNHVQAQVTGQTPAMAGTTNTYTFSGGSAVFPTWQVTPNGQILSSWQNGAVYNASIKWNMAGTGLVTFKDGSTTKGTLTVPITVTPVPPVGVAASRCGSGSVTLSATAGQGGNTVRWYQNSTGGTPMSTGLSYSTPVLSTNTTYYVTTYNSSNGAESANPRVAVQATIKPLPSAPVVSGNSRFGVGTMTLTAAGGTIYTWYNPSGTLLATSTSYTTPTISTNVSNYLYVKTIGSNGCMSSDQTWVSLSLLVPEITSNNARVVLNTNVTLDGGDNFTTYEWKNAQGQIVGTNSRYLNINTPGDYTVKVTKTGLTGSATSTPFQVKKQFEGQNANYVVSNSFLVASTTTSSVMPEHISQVVQYFDGLGRQVQQVITRGSASAKDLIFPTRFDAYGRENVKYLPYTEGNNGWYKQNALEFLGNTEQGDLARYRTGDQYDFYQGNDLVADDPFPYAESLFEPSPLNRITQQGHPGEKWQPHSQSTYHIPVQTNHSRLSVQEFNTANEVIRWDFTFSTVPFEFGKVSNFGAPQYYLPNELIKTRNKDENFKEIIQYHDKEGKMVLRRVQAVENPSTINDVNYASTYYIYDDFGNLVVVITPEGTKRLATEFYQAGATDLTRETYYGKWTYRYCYDSRRRIVKKAEPGSKPVLMIYDNRDRLVLTQTPTQGSGTNKEWLFTKYDAFNRQTGTGKYFSNSTQSALQDEVNNYYSNMTTAKAWYESYVGDVSGNVNGYDNKSFPVSNTQYLTVLYYDKVDDLMAPPQIYAYKYDNLLDPETNVSQDPSPSTATRGKLVAALNKDLKTNSWLRTVNYYDKKGRLIQSITDHQKGYLRLSLVVGFAGEILVSVKSYKVNADTYTISENKDYDRARRVVSVKHSVNGSVPVTTIKNEYNELGLVVDKKLHSTNGTEFLQSIDQRYDVRGWLTRINHADVSTIGADDGDSGFDFFGMELKYDEEGSSLSPDMYNGVASRVEWSKGFGGRVRKHTFAYHFDVMDRLKHADYYLFDEVEQEWNSERKAHSERNIQYDLNGNINQLVRYDAFGFVSNMDSLKYNYSGNLLTSVVDYGNPNAGFFNGTTGITNSDYVYDDNGRLKSDANKNFTAITYNHLDQPVTVSRSATDFVEYYYDAQGSKLAQEVHGTAAKLTEYIGELVFENGVLQYISHSEGRIIPDGQGWEYQYFIRDNIGNVRVTFTSKTQQETVASTNFEQVNNPDFLNYRFISGWDLVDHTDAGTTFSRTQLINGGFTTGRVGVAKSMEVMPGDQISASAWVKYMANSSGGSVQDFTVSLANAFNVSGTSTGEQAKIFSGLNSYALTVPDGSHDNDDDNQKKVFITILLFNKEYKLVDAAWEQVTADGEQVSGLVKEPPHDNLAISAIATEAGYAYVFVSNEEPEPLDVYFDDVEIVHTPSPIVAVDDYFAFGLSFNNGKREGSTDQDVKHIGKELQTELSLNWYDFGKRMYMPEIGRWGTLDPLAGDSRRWSPYAYCFDNPVRFKDPDGMFPSVGVELVYCFDNSIQVGGENGDGNGGNTAANNNTNGDLVAIPFIKTLADFNSATDFLAFVRKVQRGEIQGQVINGAGGGNNLIVSFVAYHSKSLANTSWTVVQAGTLKTANLEVDKYINSKGAPRNMIIYGGHGNRDVFNFNSYKLHARDFVRMNDNAKSFVDLINKATKAVLVYNCGVGANIGPNYVREYIKGGLDVYMSTGLNEGSYAYKGHRDANGKIIEDERIGDYVPMNKSIIASPEQQRASEIYHTPLIINLKDCQLYQDIQINSQGGFILGKKVE